MKQFKPLVLSFVLAAQVGMASANSLPPLREVKEIDTNMLWVAIAIEISDKCPTIAPRTAKGLSFLWSLGNKAKSLGYSREEIDAYRTSDMEKARIRAAGEAYLRAQGFDPSTEAGLCAAGEAELARGSIIGSFLRRAS